MPADVPWVPDRAATQAEMDRVAALVGRTVVAVRYLELEYELPEPLWAGPEFDALDFGLELDLEDSATWSFAWLQAGPNEGVPPLARGT